MSVPAEIIDHLWETHQLTCQGAAVLSGGCIHHAQRIDTQEGAFFLKYNAAGSGHNFAVESKGLALLGEKGGIRVPKVLGHHQCGTYAYLLTEFILPQARNKSYWEDLGTSLAQLHQVTAPQFGLDHNNYIGALPQRNHWHDNWGTFYVEERLRPMLGMARERQRMTVSDQQAVEDLFLKLPQMLPLEAPALIHGDLWGGNLLCGPGGKAVLIDPAVYYGHREIELAFMSLFDHQPAEFFESYESVYPLASGWPERIQPYLLYPLLVHVNLFGGNYVQSVRQIVQRYG